jgi:hypothetical protein
MTQNSKTSKISKNQTFMYNKKKKKKKNTPQASNKNKKTKKSQRKGNKVDFEISKKGYEEQG